MAKEEVKYYTGWAMDVYPDMSEGDIAHHVERQICEGANFVWIGHNNPGEVDEDKVEPALSYAVYEAYINRRDPRKEAAKKIIAAQERMLDFCLKEKIPVVLPVGYQMQMGEVWNREHPKHLRRTYDGKIINAGGVSACFYSPAYRRDIKKYYRWVNERFIEKYHSIILMVNLADEPFGGDYSQYAEAVFRRRHCMWLKEAARGDLEIQTQLGKFQSNYVAEYAAWSANAWHDVCPSIPSTMSFCGSHGREENVMPSVQGLFELTPEHFHPTFDVYPRDGGPEKPIKQSDINMLLVLLKQLGYLSHKYSRPYWLWTTGNSWGLGQKSRDKANIADAMANQFYATSSAVNNRGCLKGIAVWNYNIRNQGLYDDPNPIIYDPDEMFKRLTRFLAKLRGLMRKRDKRAIDVAIVLARAYGDRCVGKSRRWVRVRPFGFEQMAPLLKDDLRIVVDESCVEVFEYIKREREKMPEIIFYLSDGSHALSKKERNLLIEYALEGGKIVLPIRLARDAQLVRSLKKRFASAILQYRTRPDNIAPSFYEKAISTVSAGKATLYPFSIGKIRMIYNVSKRTQGINVYLDQKAQKCCVVKANGEIKKCVQLHGGAKNNLVVGHHQICFITPDGEMRVPSLIKSLENS